ncbi:hypothetical protein A6A03_06500 [Chloroflexus islandicus]|uniref:Uncharacterized protein n=1 Tax=Chloroflexus islandicus TaxID=1707952 RepID=A0A178MNN5_9CHLR|nr:hypothetical protein [Chloroflexus islandicus]OAN49705.1 hypothetical protein A6A03_06500 [Chloroflexus islandicus]
MLNQLHRQLHILKHWGTHVVAIVVALELGVLSPLGCVLHCLIQQWMAERATPNFFFCDLHLDGMITEDAVHLARVHPRAMYEALPPLVVAAVLVVPLILLLALPCPALLRVCPLPPPTPPPRACSLG